MADAYIMDAVAEIFSDDPDLLEEFKYFLPGTIAIRHYD